MTSTSTPLKTGARLRSQVDDTQVVVVRAPASPVLLSIGGAPVIELTGAPDTSLALDPALSAGSLLGKRYTDAAGTLELLVSKGGLGTLTADGVPLQVKASKQLPSSD